MQQKARPTEPNLPAWFSLIPHSSVVTSLPPLNRNTTRLSAYTVTRSMVPHQSFSSNSRGRASLGKGRPCGCLVRDFDFVRVQAVGGVADAVCRIYNEIFWPYPIHCSKCQRLGGLRQKNQHCLLSSLRKGIH